MAALGIRRVRGGRARPRGRVAHRMCLDHPERVSRAAVLDIVPTRYVFATATRRWRPATTTGSSWPAGRPARAADRRRPRVLPAALLGGWWRRAATRSPRRRWRSTSVLRATRRHPRDAARTTAPAAGIDLEHDEADYGRGRSQCPLLVLWGAQRPRRAGLRAARRVGRVRHRRAGPRPATRALPARGAPGGDRRRESRRLPGLVGARRRTAPSSLSPECLPSPTSASPRPSLEALTHLGYEQPTPIQEQTIPAPARGRDVIGQAQTGTGKTAAFGLPAARLRRSGDEEIQALVLTPTRELCIQVTQALRAYGERRGVGVTAVFGGAPIRTQVAQLKEGAQVVVGTVGRVMDLMSRHELVLSRRRYVVLDEADEMLDLGFLEDVETILSRCPSGPPDRALLGHHAAGDRQAGREADVRPGDHQGARGHADHRHRRAVPRRGRPTARSPTRSPRVLKAERPDQAIIFVRTKIGVDRLARRLSDKRHAGQGAARRHDPGLARRGDDRLQGRPRAAARGHRHRRPRARHLRRHPRHQLRRAELARRLRPPHRAHRPRRALGAGHHPDHRQAAARPRGDREARGHRDRRVGAGCGGEGAAKPASRTGGGAGAGRRDDRPEPPGAPSPSRCGRRAARAGRAAAAPRAASPRRSPRPGHARRARPSARRGAPRDPPPAPHQAAPASARAAAPS